MEKSLPNPTLPLESDENTTHLSVVNSNFYGQGGVPSVVPFPRPEVCSFDWNSLVQPCLPSYVLFHIKVKVDSQIVHQTVIDDGASISILSSTTCKYPVFPN